RSVDRMNGNNGNGEGKAAGLNRATRAIVTMAFTFTFCLLVLGSLAMLARDKINVTEFAAIFNPFVAAAGSVVTFWFLRPGDHPAPTSVQPPPPEPPKT